MPPPQGPLPSPRQLAWHEREFYAFVHFGPNTFTGEEWGRGDEDPAVFNPGALDCRQWVQAFRSAGMTGVVLTAKHHDGFCNWPSRHSRHTVAHTAWRGGRGDVVRELADACREAGLALGVYLSPWDRNHPDYGRNDAAYNDFFARQLEELLRGYGPLFEVWWDGANGDRGDPAKFQEYDWNRFIGLVRQHQPEAVIFSDTGPDIRWIGNESGVAGATCWATMHSRRMDPGSGDPTPAQLNAGEEGGDAWLPGEVDVSIRPGWFWRAPEDARVKSVPELVKIYEESVGRGCSLILNVPPDARGLIHETDVQRLAGLGTVLRATYGPGTNLAAGRPARASSAWGGDPAFGAGAVTDGDPRSSWAAADGQTAAWIEIDLEPGTVFDRVVLAEPIALGQRVRRFTVEARDNGQWSAIASGTTIGRKRIVVLDTVITADALRVSVLDARATPLLSELGLHRLAAR